MLWCHLGRYFYSPRFCLVWFGWLHQVIDCPHHLDRMLVSIMPSSYSLLLPLHSHLKQNNLKIIS